MNRAGPAGTDRATGKLHEGEGTPMAGEFDYIAWLRARTPADPRVLVGPGDDCAVLAPAARPLLVTTDMLMDGTDFVVAEVGPRRAGRKAMAANLSDIAAMAGKPVAAVVGVVLPRSGGMALAEELYLGLRDVADSFEVPIVGGDTNSWAGPLVVSVTVLGEVVGRGRGDAGRGEGGRLALRHRPFGREHPGPASRLHAAHSRGARASCRGGPARDVRHQ